MNLTIKQSTDRTEQVSSSLVDKLYQLTKPDSVTGLPMTRAILVGRILTPAAYEDAVNSLNTLFSVAQDNGSDFQVSVLNNNYYIRFADPEAEEVVKAALGKEQDEGVTSSELSSFRPNFNGNTVIEYFDEMKYCWPNVLNYAFKDCTNLKSIDLTNIARLSDNGNCFRGCINLEYFHGIDGERGVLNLTNLISASFTYWFANCKKLERITSLGVISSIGGLAFSGCSALESVTGISNVTTISTSAFENCSLLSIITLQNITSIGDSAFKACSSLEYCGGPNSTQGELYLPNLTGTLGGSAFKGCTKLTSIASLGGITSISGSAFENCGNLATINFPSTITSVGNNAFNNTAWYNSQPDGPVYIAKALYKCKNVSGAIVIPNNIVSITREAFFNCSSLTSVTISSNVASIDVGSGVFTGCTALSTVVVDSNNGIYDSRDNCNAIINTSTNTLIAGCKNTVIPNSVTSIGGSAFSGCINLNLGNGDFDTDDYPALTTIGDGAFKGVSFNNIHIGLGVTVGSNLFGSTTVNNVFFEGSSNKEHILSDGRFVVTGTLRIGSAIGIIPHDCFRDINRYDYSIGVTLQLDEGITKISSSAFQYTALNGTVEIPSTVTEIETYAFLCYPKPSYSLKFKTTIPPTLGKNFVNSTYVTKVYVPSGSTNSYLSKMAEKNDLGFINTITPKIEEYTP